MNPDQPSREQIEARITALLLGELPAAEAELLRWTISGDAELKKLHDQLKLTIGFVSEAMKNPTSAPVEREAQLKLSPERRQKVLAHFKTARPQKLFWLKQIKIPSAYSLAIAAVVILVMCGLVAISIPNFVKARSTSQANACINNLRQIDAAKNEWALEKHMPANAVPTANDLTPYIQLTSSGEIPNVAGERYVFGEVSQPTVAELNGKLLTAPGSLQAENLAMAEHANNKSLSPFASRLTTVRSRMENVFQPSQDANVFGRAKSPSPQPAPIALPNTETFQTESGQNAGTTVYSQSVVGYVNVNGGNPVRVVEVSPGANAPSARSIFQSSQQEQPTGPIGVTEIPPAAAGGNYTWSPAAQPLPMVNGPLPAPTESALDGDRNVGFAANGLQDALAYATNGTPYDLRWFNFPDGGGNQSSANSALITSEVIPLKYAKADEIARTLSSLGGAGGGTVSFGSATTPGTTGSHNGFAGSVNTFGVAGQGGESSPLVVRENQNANTVVQTGVSAITPTYYVTDGTVHITGYTFKDGSRTNFIAGNQSAFYRMVNGRGGQGGEPSEQSPFIARENQNASTIGKTSDVNGPINPATGLPENAPSGSVPVLGQVPIIGRLFTAQATPPQQTEEQLARVEPTMPPPQQPRGQYAQKDVYSGEPQMQFSFRNESNSAKLDDQPSTPPQNNLADNEMIPPGLIDFQGADASQVLEVYAQLSGRTLLRADLPKAQIVLKTDAPLTRTNAIQALQGVLALNGIAVVNVGDKFVKALPVGEAGTAAEQTDKPLPAPMIAAPVPQPEILTRDNAFSTFSLNVSDVSFKLAAASLEKGQMPAPDSIRSEEFINAFDYRDPEPLQGQPLAFRFERAQDPFAQERDLLRFSIKAAAAGRPEGRALNLVLLLDTSGSMERADRVAIIREALRVLASQLQPQDTVSVVTFARTARLWADGVPGNQAGATLDKVGSITPEGGTNLEEAMRLAYETALRHFLANGMNRVVLLTDGAANLGNVDPQALTQKVETERRQGIALDCFGIGWEDYNDDLLATLSSNGDGRYAFINSPDEAAKEFAAKLAGALQVAAEDVKVQVEFNPDRVTAWRQIGYAKHQLTKEQFHDNSVAAGAIAAREAGNALYVIETKPDGEGPLATVRVRYRVPGTQDNCERSWLVDYTATTPALAQASPAMRLAATAAETSEWLANSPFAQDVTPDELLNYLSGVPQFYGADERPKQLEWMIRQAQSVSGK